MTNRKRFFYNATLLTIVGLFVKTVNLAFGAFVSRKIGAEALGLFTLIGTLYAFAVTFASSGISLTVTRLVAKSIGEGREYEIPRIMRHAMGYALIFSSFASIVLFTFAPYFASAVLGDGRALLSLKVLSFSLVPIAVSATLSGYFTGVKKIVRSSFLGILSQIAKISVTIVLVTEMAEKGVASACLALCVSTTVSEILSFVFSFLIYLFSGEKRCVGEYKTSFSDVSSMALPLALSACVRSALLTLEHVLIPRRLVLRSGSESSALAEYGVLHGMALPIILYPMSPLSSFSGLLVPEFAECQASGNTLRLSRISAEVIRNTLCYAAPVAVFIFSFSEEIAYALYSSYEAGRYAMLLAAVIPIMYLDHVTDAMLKGIGEHVYSMWVNVTDSLLSVILIWFLIPAFGILGYGLVIVIMEGYNFLLSYLRLRTKIKFRKRELFSFAMPFFEAVLSAYLTNIIFEFSGSLTTLAQLISKIVFASCVFLLMNVSERLVFKEKALSIH